MKIVNEVTLENRAICELPKGTLFFLDADTVHMLVYPSSNGMTKSVELSTGDLWTHAPDNRVTPIPAKKLIIK